MLIQHWTPVALLLQLKACFPNTAVAKTLSWQELVSCTCWTSLIQIQVISLPFSEGSCPSHGGAKRAVVRPVQTRANREQPSAVLLLCRLYEQYLDWSWWERGKREKSWEKWTRRLRSKEWQMKLKIVPSAVVKEIRLTGGCFFCQEWFVMQETIPTPALLILVVSLTDKKEQGLTSLEPQPA